MREEVFSLPLGDGFTLYGRINRPAQKADKAVVLCHGLTGHLYEHHYQVAKNFFTERGYDVYRFNFYGEERNARNITHCTVALHAEDLNKLLDHLKPQYEKLYVTGHSYGGLTVVMANSPHIAAASLWDASFIAVDEDEWWTKNWIYNQELDEYILCWKPIALVVGKKFYEELLTCTGERMRGWVTAFTKPAQVLAAGGFVENLPNQRKLFESLTVEKEWCPIEGAGHGFSVGNEVYDLLENTYRWFQKF